MKTTVAIILESLKQKFNKELLQVEQRQDISEDGQKKGSHAHYKDSINHQE